MVRMPNNLKELGWIEATKLIGLQQLQYQFSIFDMIKWDQNFHSMEDQLVDSSNYDLPLLSK